MDIRDYGKSIYLHLFSVIVEGPSGMHEGPYHIISKYSDYTSANNEIVEYIHRVFSDGYSIVSIQPLHIDFDLT